MKKKLAILFDFDDTLCPDSTDLFLKSRGIDTELFWKEADQLVFKDQYDPVLAYFNLIFEYSHKPEFSSKFTKHEFQKFGQTLKYYPGVSTFLKKLQTDVKGLGHEIEYYVISSGIHSIIEACSLRSQFKKIYASEFVYQDKTGAILFPKRVVSFTDKTRFLFAISKRSNIGEEDNPFRVNEKVWTKKYEIPFKNMIYVGDGLTDIPCFTLLSSYGGYSIGVYADDKIKKAKVLLSDERVRAIACHDYSQDSPLSKHLYRFVEQIINRKD